MNGTWLFSSKYHSSLSQFSISNRPTSDVFGLEYKRPLPSCLLEKCVYSVLKCYLDQGYKIFLRAKKFNEIYTSKLHDRQVKYNNYSVIIIGRSRFGEIQCFFKKRKHICCILFNQSVPCKLM